MHYSGEAEKTRTTSREILESTIEDVETKHWEAHWEIVFDTSARAI